MCRLRVQLFAVKLFICINSLYYMSYIFQNFLRFPENVTTFQNMHIEFYELLIITPNFLLYKI